MLKRITFFHFFLYLFPSSKLALRMVFWTTLEMILRTMYLEISFFTKNEYVFKSEYKKMTKIAMYTWVL